MAEIIYLNGRFIPLSKAKLSPFDHGFLYGYGLFENMRAYQGHVFRLNRHLTLLRHSAESIGLANRLSTYDLEAAYTKTLDANKLKYARLKFTVSAGESDMAPDPGTYSNPTVLVTARDLIPLPLEKI